MILHVDKPPLYFLCSFCWYFHKIVWWFYFSEISNCCVFANLPYIPTSPFTNFGDFCQAPRLLHPSHLSFWPKFASLPVYSTLPFYLKLKSMLFSRNTLIWIFFQLVLRMVSFIVWVSFICMCLFEWYHVCLCHLTNF